ncbi:MAG: hypothetical protein MSS61_06000 [Bacteroidales bacterium]|nr:hypothetical protein [Bacteroidales bacterium]MDY2914370.1 hypothetical protein [Alloprevotella sp.]MDY4741066.1 hypothetical protein [Alloprevotella sp.]MDY4874491.1 hypothetical protein [Alloprevotella sp.]
MEEKIERLLAQSKEMPTFACPSRHKAFALRPKRNGAEVHACIKEASIRPAPRELSSNFTYQLKN